MNVNVMRKIDFYVGIPLTFIATGIIKFFDLFRKPPQKIKKILFIEMSEMGSTILADPAMRKAKETLSAELYFLIFKKNKASLDILQTVPAKNIFTVREDNFAVFVWDVLRYLVWCRKQKFTAVIDLELFSRATALLSGFAGANYRVGFYAFHNEGLYRGHMLTHKVAYNPHIHIAKNFISLVEALIRNNNELPYTKLQIKDSELQLPKINSSTERRQAIYAKIKTLNTKFSAEKNPIILINPNASDLLPQRRWLPEYFITLMQTILAAHPEHYILITGAPAEQAQAASLVAEVNNIRCLNFAGQTKFTQLIDLYNVSTLMVSNDSGPGHFSAVTELRTFIIFGPETPKLYGSLGNSTPIYSALACSPCVSATNHRNTPCRNNVCLQVIKPDYVYQLIKPCLGSVQA